MIYGSVKLVPIESMKEFHALRANGDEQPAYGMVYFVLNSQGVPEANTFTWQSNRSEMIEYFKAGRLYRIDTNIAGSLFSLADNTTNQNKTTN